MSDLEIRITRANLFDYRASIYRRSGLFGRRCVGAGYANEKPLAIRRAKADYFKRLEVPDSLEWDGKK